MHAHRAGRAAAIALVAMAALAACTRPGVPIERRGPVSLEGFDAIVRDATHLGLEVPSCNGQPVVDALEQDAASVRIRVVTTVHDPGDACLDSIQVVLDAPLGDRRVVDLVSGAQLEVRGVDG